jgi:hypothetical protein
VLADVLKFEIHDTDVQEAELAADTVERGFISADYKQS